MKDPCIVLPFPAVAQTSQDQSEKRIQGYQTQLKDFCKEAIMTFQFQSDVVFQVFGGRLLLGSTDFNGVTLC